MKNIITLCSLFVLVNVSSALALSIDMYQSGNNVDISNWKASRGGQVQVLENFENRTPGWFSSLNTGVGTFTAGGEAGDGTTSYNAMNTNSQDTNFSIQDRSGDWNGRYDTTDGLNGSMSKWLDSGDVTLLHLTGISSSLTNLFFYIQDASDWAAITSIYASTGRHDVSSNINPGQPNGMSYFVGITLDPGETLNEISWNMRGVNDGFGLDDFSTVTPVPEPATIFLFGSGLLGLARVARRKKQ